MAEHTWHKPPGSNTELTPDSLGKLQQAVNYPKGLHSDTIEHDLVLPGSGPGSRLLLVGPITTPVGVTVTLQPGSVMVIL